MFSLYNNILTIGFWGIKFYPPHTPFIEMPITFCVWEIKFYSFLLLEIYSKIFRTAPIFISNSNKAKTKVMT